MGKNKVTADLNSGERTPLACSIRRLAELLLILVIAGGCDSSSTKPTAQKQTRTETEYFLQTDGHDYRVLAITPHGLEATMNIESDKDRACGDIEFYKSQQKKRKAEGDSFSEEFERLQKEGARRKWQNADCEPAK